MSEENEDQESQKVVLVIEDEPDTRAVIVHTLSAKSYKILEAVDGREAMKLCEEELPDVIVTDIMMPHVDGLEFIRWFRENHASPFVPILVLTALTQVEEKVEGLEQGADDYLTKPFNYRELQARVSALLRIKDLTEMLNTQAKDLEQANHELSEMQNALLKKERQLVTVQLAGAAAHNLGQPITTILLNCRILERMVPSAGEEKEQASSALRAIQNECREVKEILDRMKLIDPEATENYIGETEIISFKGSLEK